FRVGGGCSVRAALQLSRIGIGDVREALGAVKRLGIVAPAAARITGVAGMIGEVELVRIVERDAALFCGLTVVPADELHGVGKVGAPRAPSAGLALVAVPGAVERL